MGSFTIYKFGGSYTNFHYFFWNVDWIASNDWHDIVQSRYNMGKAIALPCLYIKVSFVEVSEVEEGVVPETIEFT